MKRTCLLVILVGASLGLAQAPPAQKKPLDQIQVLALLAGGVPSPRVAMLVNERGKLKMQALVAVMRKLLHAFHGMFKTHQPYDGSKLFQRQPPGPREVPVATTAA